MDNKDTALSKEDQQIFNELTSGSKPLNARDVNKKYSEPLKDKLRKYYDTKEYLTVAEAAIWLGKCTDSIYSYIRKGYIVAYRSAGPQSNYKIHVGETKKLINQVNVNN